MRFSLEQIQDGMELNMGYCVKCGAERDCCEPDARNYKCEDCGKREVFGSEELLIMGLVD